MDPAVSDSPNAWVPPPPPNIPAPVPQYPAVYNPYGMSTVMVRYRSISFLQQSKKNPYLQTHLSSLLDSWFTLSIYT